MTNYNSLNVQGLADEYAALLQQGHLPATNARMKYILAVAQDNQELLSAIMQKAEEHTQQTRLTA